MSVFNRRPIDTAEPWHVGGWHQAKEVCEQLGMEVAIDNLHTLTVGDFVRLAYNLGAKASESRLASPDVADGIALALETPAAILEKNASESHERWLVRAVQQVVAFGVPQ